MTHLLDSLHAANCASWAALFCKIDALLYVAHNDVA